MSERPKMQDCLTAQQREVADLIGMDNYEKLMESYGGDVIYIPTKDVFAREERNARIREEFNGFNYKELALKYGLTTIWIRSIVEPVMENFPKVRQVDGQTSLFDEN